MFRKKERLNRSDFDHYFKIGERHHFPEVTIITSKSENRQVAVVVGKKVSKSAVRRNILRRRVYSLLRSELGNSSYQGVIIIILKPKFNSLTKSAAAEIVCESIAEVVKSA
tara:strand:+ start:21221 stop:21553 length:333 start_codon:yes stop_codon:yes gene_type:complete